MVTKPRCADCEWYVVENEFLGFCEREPEEIDKAPESRCRYWTRRTPVNANLTGSKRNRIVGGVLSDE